ncbi:MAG: glycosyltransferase [Lachnospiraceae bacterium]|nr:glycosyltransferase [Lachnospiraceae bacterium]
MELSVIIPVHNGENYIRRCLKSVRTAVKDLDAEIIVINDGSSDGTGAILEDIVSKCNNIRVVPLDDRGVSCARNTGIKEARGEFISFVDADDIVSHNIFTRLIKTARDSGSEITGCSFFKWSNIDNVTDTLDREYMPTKYGPENYMKEEILKGNCRCWSKIYQSSLLKENGPVLFDETLTVGEDMLFLAEAVNKAKCILELKGFTGYGYYENSTGVMARPFEMSFMDQIKCWEMMTKYTKDQDCHKNLVVAIMLVASKIACLPLKTIKNYDTCVKECHDKLKKYMSEDPKIKEKLDRGYKIKTSLFALSPKLYLFIYHIWKR